MPFGLTNAPTNFMCMMNNIFSKYMDKFVLVFIDNILVYSKNKEKHEEYLCIVLRVLREHHLYAKFSKCDFYKPQIQYLGHIISEVGIVVDPEKIRSIKDWPTPTGVTDIMSFLVLVRYYRNFIENFSRIACPMTALHKKESKFLWTTKCEESFQNLKQLLMTALELWIADLDGDFVVSTDARNKSLGRVLFKNDHVIYYELRKLKEHEKNYLHTMLS